MINSSKAFKSKQKKVLNADITLRNGMVLNLGPSDFVLGGFSMSDESSSGKFSVGNAIGKTISISISNHNEKFSLYDFNGAILYVYISVKDEEGNDWRIRKGKYYVINPTTPGEVINLSGVDSMHLFDKPYIPNILYPATLQNILIDCCVACGVNAGFNQFENSDFVVNNPPTESTYRQVVSWCAQIAGGNARINNDDYLEIVWYDRSLIENILDGQKYISLEPIDTYDGGNFTEYTDSVLYDGGNFSDIAPENITKIKSIKVSTDDVVITGVKVKNGEKEVLNGEEGYCITVSDNEFVSGKENEVAEYLGNKLNGLTFRPLSCEIANNPLIEPYDVCYVYDRKGNYYLALINSVQYSISGFTNIACNAEDPVRNESSYVSKEAQAVVKAKREMKSELSTYDKAVQNMNMLAANAMGLYRESEVQADGSVIYYQSNKPIYKNQNGICEFVIMSVVYKMTGDGFFVSTDGGLSYTSGFDSQGNAVVNVLSAIGITFDWAKGGTLTLGGENNINGSINVLDQYGKSIGKWDKDGITVSGADEKITQITKNTVTTDFVNALNVKAGSVDAENITGTTISGKQIIGSTVYIDDESGEFKYSMDSKGFGRLYNDEDAIIRVTYNFVGKIEVLDVQYQNKIVINFDDTTHIPKRFIIYPIEVSIVHDIYPAFLKNYSFDHIYYKSQKKLEIYPKINGYYYDGNEFVYTTSSGVAKIGIVYLY